MCSFCKKKFDIGHTLGNISAAEQARRSAKWFTYQTPAYYERSAIISPYFQ